MTFSREITDQIAKFAREQSRFYLEDAEMTYLEKLRRKSGQTRDKIKAKLAKFKSRSDTAVEAENDMILYMSDYMKDLIAEGYSEQEAFERAKQELAFRSDTAKSSDLRKRFEDYYRDLNPADYEAAGLFYAGFLFIGVAIGGIAGYLAGGGRTMFLSGGWVDTLIGTAAGGILGIGCGLIGNAVITLTRKR